MADSEIKDAEPPSKFGDTLLGAGIGCAAIILATGLSVAAILWAIVTH
jgi:hypothetical protein